MYRAEWRNIQSVAVKQLKQHDARNDIRFLREIAILKECRSGHVVQFLVRLLRRPSCLPPAPLAERKTLALEGPESFGGHVLSTVALKLLEG